MPLSHKKKKESQLIPVLFTIGIIGWGFFAIDRLTSSQLENELKIKNNFHNVPVRVNQPNNSFLREVKEWISMKLTRLVSENLKKDNLAVLSEASLHLGEVKDIQTKKIKSDNHNLINAKLYFYKAYASSMKLYPVERQISLQGSENIEKAVFRELLAGPNGNERVSNFLDSFPQKIKILSAKQNGNVMTINFKNSFSFGVSHQMIKSQLKQLLATAKEFKGISKIKLMSNNKPLKKLGSDGLILPKLIDENSWLLSSTY